MLKCVITVGLSIVGGDRVASSNKKQLIKVQVVRFDNLESYELAQVRIRKIAFNSFITILFSLSL